jgi:four helix bundle protein
MRRETHFKFKDLNVWQKALDFSIEVIKITENINSARNHFRLIEQLESSSASVGQNIAEGKGRQSIKEFIRFLYISRASLYETLKLLNLFQKMNWISLDQLNKLEAQSFEIASMTKGLINSLCDKMPG